MKTKKILPVSLFLFCLILFFYYSCTKDVGRLPTNNPLIKTLCDTVNITYSKDILPILQNNCSTVPGCHVKGGSGTGNFTLYSGVSAYADPPVGDGSLRARVLNAGRSTDGSSGWMPASNPLPLLDRQKIDCWLKANAPNN